MCRSPRCAGSLLFLFSAPRLGINDDAPLSELFANLHELGHDVDVLWTLLHVVESTDGDGESLRLRVWCREAVSRADGVVVVAAGPYHEGTPPDVARKP